MNFTCNWCGAPHNRPSQYCSKRCAHQANGGDRQHHHHYHDGDSGDWSPPRELSAEERKAKELEDEKQALGCSVFVIPLIGWWSYGYYPWTTIIVGSFLMISVFVRLGSDELK